MRSIAGFFLMQGTRDHGRQEMALFWLSDAACALIDSTSIKTRAAFVAKGCGGRTG